MSQTSRQLNRVLRIVEDTPQGLVFARLPCRRGLGNLALPTIRTDKHALDDFVRCPTLVRVSRAASEVANLVRFTISATGSRLVQCTAQSRLGLEVKSRNGFDMQGIDDRLAYVDSVRIVRCLARWAGPPCNLFNSDSRNACNSLHRGRAESYRSRGLRLRIQSGCFAPGQSVGVLVGKAVLLDRLRADWASWC